MSRPACATGERRRALLSDGLSMRPRIMLALWLRGVPIGNTELREAIGAPGVPPCTVTWNLNELADLGWIASNRMGRFNRWTLTAAGGRLVAELIAPLDAQVLRLIAERRQPAVSGDVIRQASAQARRSVFDV